MNSEPLPVNFDAQVQISLKTLSRGGIILYPTDTVWGVGCDATNSRAIEKVYRIKERTESKSLIILLDTPDKLSNYVQMVPPIVYDLIESITKPLTIIYSNAKNLPRNVASADKTIAIRIVRESFCKTLIQAFGKPIVSTSANISNEPVPMMFSQVSKRIISAVDHVVDLYHDVINNTQPSTIIRLRDNGSYVIIRE